MKRGSLAVRVLLVSVCFFALPLFIYSLIVFRQEIHTDLRLTIDRLKDLGQSRARILELFNRFDFEALDICEDLLGSHPMHGEGILGHFVDEARANRILGAFTGGGRYEEASFVSIMPDGRLICTASSPPQFIGRDFSDFGFMHLVLERGKGNFLIFGQYSFFRYHVTAKVVTEPNGTKPLGVLFFSERAETLLDALLQTEEGGYPVNFSLLSEAGVIFASGNPEFSLRSLRPLTDDQKDKLHYHHNFPVEELRAGTFDIKPIADVDGALYFTYEGQRHIGVVVPVQGTEFSLLLDADVESIFGPQYAYIRHAWLIFGIILVVGGTLTFVLTRGMGRPLRRLRETMQQVAEGDLSARFTPGRLGFEINRLGEIFNSTLVSLGENITKAEDERVAKETLSKELQIGTEIQMSLLPHKRIDYPSVEISTRFLSAKEVGGDFYDVYAKEEHLAVTVADAADKGISACLYSFSLRSILRSYLAEYDSPAQIMQRANNVFYADTEESSMFVTAFMAIYHPDSRTLTYSSCGHLPGLLRRSNGEIEELHLHSLALGIQPTQEVPEACVQVAPGDTLVLYTDGVTEALNPQEQIFGHERLLAFLKQSDLPPNELADALLAETQRWAEDTAQADDTTLTVLRFS